MRRRVARFVRISAFQRGVLGSSRTWFGVWVLLVVARLARRLSGRDPQVLERFELRAGEGVVITDTGVTRKAWRR